MEQIECSETSAYNNQTTGKYPKEYIEDPKTFCDNMIPDFEKYFEHSNTDQKVVKNFDFKCHFYWNRESKYWGVNSHESDIDERRLRNDMRNVTTDSTCQISGRKDKVRLWKQIASKGVPAHHIVATMKEVACESK